MDAPVFLFAGWASDAAAGAGRAAAFARFPKRGRHSVADVLHGQDDLVAADGTSQAAKRHLRGAQGLRDANV